MSALADALAGALGDEVRELRRIPGGSLNDAWAATLASGERIFVKTSADAAPGVYTAEATGLRWLAAARALPLPFPRAVLDAAAPAPDAPAPDAPAPDAPAPDADAAPPIRLLALPWIDAAPPAPDADERLGRGLARLHAAGASRFGAPDGSWRIGPISIAESDAAAPAAAAPAGTRAGAATWPAFYAEHRLRPLARLAHARGGLDDAALRLTERVIERLHGGEPGIAGPPEPPARLHGDLWGGNVMHGPDGEPWLIDPAAHGGHREVDLAMLRLFGGPGPRAFAAYEEVAPLAPGAAERVALWQAAPLLLHAALFGGGYGPRAAAALRGYV
ncbi:fructosamine kinase family protein [Conexibacter sp. JD483]|uniref:fructosamine kinase family protein n=1 Tax=unclassified Conexibacter TaxID=2627773 RepID=UPI00271EA2FA|nr:MULTISPECIES: fructosamine kinase family protein [unclassified Conexibacter]MDO8186389.1 fructosamine kinase family protein [Conexibacter sp. CPCC 205706]MDO8199788.1 fructosamine kinase family protein [Conexibacter sp. CPCC 205762]MDR9369192.1 fructosamine kinase family protein [Conexibacter sp. JD483]